MELVWLAATLIVPLARPGLPTAPIAPRSSTAAIAALSPVELQRAIRARARLSLTERVAYWSRQFLETPYQTDSPEHPGPTGVELLRVDCETYVEQVMALGLSRRFSDVAPLLHRIRFAGGRGELHSRHFTVVQGWLAANTRAGFLKDITRTVGGRATRTLSGSLSPSAKWRPYYLRRFRLLGPRAPRGIATIDYIPLHSALGLLRRIPPSTVVHIVSAPHPRSPYLVTHVGLTARTQYGLVFRHASQSPHRRRVEDRHFASYLYYIGRTPSGPELRTAIGIHLSRIKEP